MLNKMTNCTKAMVPCKHWLVTIVTLHYMKSDPELQWVKMFPYCLTLNSTNQTANLSKSLHLVTNWISSLVCTFLVSFFPAFTSYSLADFPKLLSEPRIFNDVFVRMLLCLAVTIVIARLTSTLFCYWAVDCRLCSLLGILECQPCCHTKQLL